MSGEAEPPVRGWKTWPRNVRLFLLFRVFFNARYYYPVFALLFLDLGLSLGQFAMVNAIWAVTIVTLEVPSGALADLLGRRKLLRIAAALMVVEMLCLLLPRFQPDLLLLAICINRACSGAAEAMASGSDEALAYDSLPPERQSEWSTVLEVQMRAMNGAMMVAMLVGAASYDPAIWARWLPEATAQGVAAVAPIVLTFLHALVVVGAVAMMEEAPLESHLSRREAIGAAYRQTAETVRWLLGQPRVRVVILAAVLFDHLARQGLVVSSDYLNAIGISKAYLGPLGALSALLSSLFAAPLARAAQRWKPSTLYWVLYLALMVVSFGLAYPTPYWSAVWILALGQVAGAVGYLTSLYLNQLVDSKRRATLLSVKGLAINIGYGWISVAYGLWVGRTDGQGGQPAPVIGAFAAYLPYLTVLTLLLAVVARRSPGISGSEGGYAKPEPSSKET